VTTETKQTWQDLHTALQIAERELRVTRLRLDKADERVTELEGQRAHLPPDTRELEKTHAVECARLRRETAEIQRGLDAEVQERRRTREELDEALRSLDRLQAERLDAVYARPVVPAPVVVACSCPRPDDGRSPVEIGLEILRAAGVPSQDQTDLLEPYLSGRVSAVELAISYLEKRPAVALDKADAIELVKDLEKRVTDAATAKKGAKDAAEKRVKYARDALVVRLTRRGATAEEDEDELEETADGITYLHGKKPEAPADLGGPMVPSGPPPIPEGFQR